MDLTNRKFIDLSHIYVVVDPANNLLRYRISSGSRYRVRLSKKGKFVLTTDDGGDKKYISKTHYTSTRVNRIRIFWDGGYGAHINRYIRVRCTCEIFRIGEMTEKIDHLLSTHKNKVFADFFNGRPIPAVVSYNGIVAIKRPIPD